MLRGVLPLLLHRSRNGSREAALLQHPSLLHHHGRLASPSMALPRFLALSTSGSTAAPIGDVGDDPSASPYPETAIPHSMVEYLIQSCGFSQDEASKVCKRLKHRKAFSNPDSVLSFFRGKGVGEAQFRKAVSCQPRLLYADVEKTLAPKFRVLEEMGLSVSDVLKILERKSKFLSHSLEKKLIPNISLLRDECGISGQRLLRLLRRTPRMISRSTSSLMKIIGRVRELEIRQGSMAFEMGLHMMDALSRRTLDEKLAYLKGLGWPEEVILSATRRCPLILTLSQKKMGEKLAHFKSLGWTEEETFSAIRRTPLILNFSERRIKDSIDFFVGGIGSSTSFLAANPILLTFSIEKRVRPRYNVSRFLQLKHLREGDWTLRTLLTMSEREFLDKVILKYTDTFPELNEVYGAGSLEQIQPNGFGGYVQNT